MSPGTVPGTVPDSGSWPTATNGSVAWPTPGDGLTPGGATSRLGGKPSETTVVVSPASAGSRMMPGVGAPRLVLIDPASSDGVAPEDSALAGTSDTVTKRAGRNGSTTSTAGDSSFNGLPAGTSSDRDGSLDWGRGLRILAAVAIGGLVGAHFALGRRPLFSF